MQLSKVSPNAREVIERARKLRHSRARTAKALCDIPEEGLLSPEAVATLLGLKVRTIRDWAQKRRVPHIRIPGGLIRFERKVIAALLDAVPADPAAKPRRRGKGS